MRVWILAKKWPTRKHYENLCFHKANLAPLSCHSVPTQLAGCSNCEHVPRLTSLHLTIIVRCGTVRCRDVSRGTSSQFKQPASCGLGNLSGTVRSQIRLWKQRLFMYFYASSIFVRIHRGIQHNIQLTHSLFDNSALYLTPLLPPHSI